MSTKNLNNKEDSVTSAVNVTKSKKQLLDEMLKPFIEEETKMVKGVFQCFETPGSSTKIHVKKYPGIPEFSQIMTDGQTYEIPLYVARHLNGIDVTAKAVNGRIGTCSYPVHSHILDKDGNATVSVGRRVKRYGFQSMEFAG